MTALGIFNRSSEKISFGKLSLSDAESREWLVTNGIGGYGSGTLSGILTRRYHGMLVAALDPPLGRTLLGSKCDEIIHCEGKEYVLSSDRWHSGELSPEGYRYIESFWFEGSIPVWRYTIGNALLEKRIWMEPKANTTYIQYHLSKAPLPIEISLKMMVNYRSYHQTTHAGNWHFDITAIPTGLKVEAFQGATPFYILSDRAKGVLKNEWYHGYFLKEEQERGLDCSEDHLHAGTFVSSLKEGESLTLVFTTEESADLDGNASLARRKKGESANDNKKPFWIRQLLLAAEAFIVDRSPGGKTIIAGYHWFGDWGRDTMISLPGLTITTGRSDVAKTILQTFAKFVDQGMLPNRFPDGGNPPEYNSVDASLWYFLAISSYYHATKDKDLVKEIFPVLSGMIDWFLKGTRYQIHVDAKDGLLHAGEKGVQLTWMDAKVGDFVVTPRIGKPIEVNALWVNALKIMGDFSRLLHQPSEMFDSASEKATIGFQRFWNEQARYCYDVIDGPEGDDLTLRPNQVFAVSLPFSPFPIDKQKAIVEILGSKLLTPRGLRSLSPEDSRYRGRYRGSPSERDGVYHQGTVWGYLLGPYSIAHFKVFNDKEAALKILEPMSDHLLEAGIGTCSEIFDGNPPFTPRGCIAQAWSVAEIIRAWHHIQEV